MPRPRFPLDPTQAWRLIADRWDGDRRARGAPRVARRIARARTAARWLRGLLAWACIAVLVLLGSVWSAQAWRSAHRAGGNDFTTYLLAADAIAAGESPYAIDSRFRYVYPLFLAGALVPLSALPYSLALVCWLVLNVAALGWVFVWLRGGVPEARHAFPIAAVVLLVAAPVLQSNVVNGQVNFLVLAACVAALSASIAQRPLPAALLWGVAIATKVVPLVLLPWWVVRGRAAIAGVGLLIAVLLSAGVLQGPVALAWTSAYLREFVWGHLADGAAESLRFSLADAIETVVPAATTVPGLPLAAALLVIGGVMAIDGRRGRRRDADLHAFALYLLAIPLASPKSEAHHLAAALPAAYLCALAVLGGTPVSPWRGRTLLAAAVCFWIGAMVNAAKGLCWFGALVALGLTSAGFLLEQRAGHGPRRAAGPIVGGATVDDGPIV